MLNPSDENLRKRVNFPIKKVNTEPSIGSANTSINLFRLQNKHKRSNNIRSFTQSSFFEHLKVTNCVKPLQILDKQFTCFLNQVNKVKGFRGCKTHSWGKLMYLTPQKRYKQNNQELIEVKKQLYSIIQDKNEGQPIQNPIIPTTFVEFLTGYNPKPQIDSMKSSQPVSYKHKRPGNVIREKLKSYHQNRTEYQSKMNSYQLVFKGFKIQEQKER